MGKMQKCKKRQMNDVNGDEVAVKGLQIFTFIIKTGLVRESHQNSDYKKNSPHRTLTATIKKETTKFPTEKIRKCAFDMCFSFCYDRISE